VGTQLHDPRRLANVLWSIWQATHTPLGEIRQVEGRGQGVREGEGEKAHTCPTQALCDGGP
jgi:hypothetical protein